MSDLREIEFHIQYQGERTKFRMQEMLGEADEALIVQCTKPDGNIDTAKLWIERLAVSIKEPQVNKVLLRKFTRKQLSLLKVKWLELNEATKDDFLDDPPQSQPPTEQKSTNQSESEQ